MNIISDINGNQVQLNEYDPWGKVSRSDGNVDPNHRFTGQELDSESDIHYYGGRYYDQALGRFISPDPFVQDADNPQSLARYSYVLNMPQSYIDPSGYTPIDESADFCPECQGYFLRGPLYLPPFSFNSSTSNVFDVNQIFNTYNQIQAYQASINPTVVTRSFEIPTVPGGGVWRGEFFIKNPTIFTFGEGDARGPSLVPNPSRSRAFFTLDFDQGIGVFQSNPSCVRGGGWCVAPLQLGAGSSFTVERVGRLLRIQGSLGNAITRVPKIDFDMLFTIDANRIVVNGSRDPFPSFSLTRTVNGSTNFLYERPESAIGGRCLIDNYCGSEDFGFTVKVR